MRLIRNESEVEEAYLAAKSEALSSFGDDTVYVERFVEEPHHIEFQILGDMHGNVIHLCDRECSVQRRHQKIVEESPSPFVTPELRERMGRDAVAAATAVGYVGAGTIEFLVDKDKNYFFGIMKTQAEKFEVKIYAYCIMSNHVHILAKVEFKALSLFIQETNSNYAVYYNCKYQKSGHVFQGRFFSSCVETEGYLLSCVRYIHNNPVKAGLTSDVRAYLFSSAVYYFGSDKERTQGIVSEEIFHILEKIRNSWTLKKKKKNMIFRE